MGIHTNAGCYINTIGVTTIDEGVQRVFYNTRYVLYQGEKNRSFREGDKEIYKILNLK